MNLTSKPSDSGACDPFIRGLLEHLPAILRYARVSVPLRDADDLTQDVFAQACANRHQFSGDDVGPWLYQIARSRIAMYYRSRSVEQRILQPLSGTVRESAYAPGEDVAGEIASEELQAAIAELDETEREALRLKFSKSLLKLEVLDDPALSKTKSAVKAKLLLEKCVGAANNTENTKR